jgi:hypothetical protein
VQIPTLVPWQTTGLQIKGQDVENILTFTCFWHFFATKNFPWFHLRFQILRTPTARLYLLCLLTRRLVKQS